MLLEFITFITFCNKLIFYDVLLVPHPRPQVEDHPLPAVRDFSYPPYLEAISSIRNLRTYHAVMRRDSLNMGIK
jgi:hypothetical protein